MTGWIGKHSAKAITTQVVHLGCGGDETVDHRERLRTLLAVPPACFSVQRFWAGQS